MWPPSDFPRAIPSFPNPVLPPTVDPDVETTATVCFNPAWRPYILGALKQLVLQSTWDTADPAALKLAQQRAMTLISLFTEDCALTQQVQFRQDVCGLQASFNGGSTWTTIYDPTSCVTGIVDGEIQNKINDGTLQQAGSQQSPQSPPAPGECHTYHVVLNAWERWLCPSPINSGDTVHVTAYHGGWYDGFNKPLGAWSCPDGKLYSLGTCGANQAFESTDPYQGGNHMQIVGSTASTFFDVLQNYVVPSGVSNANLFLQANDQTLTDNEGSVEFDVEICSGNWCHKFGVGFDTVWSGWQGYNASGQTAVPTLQSNGQWNAGIQSNSSYCSIKTVFPSPAHISRVRVTITGSSPNNHRVYTIVNGVLHQNVNGAGNSWDCTFDGTSVTEVDIILEKAGQTSGWTIQTVTVNGNGDSPFGSNNC